MHVLMTLTPSVLHPAWLPSYGLDRMDGRRKAPDRISLMDVFITRHSMSTKEHAIDIKYGEENTPRKKKDLELYSEVSEVADLM